jgi:hypothetical protein
VVGQVPVVPANLVAATPQHNLIQLNPVILYLYTFIWGDVFFINIYFYIDKIFKCDKWLTI